MGLPADLEGDEVDERALADQLVADMRLLMVSTVQIWNVRIIEEPHKRPKVEGEARSGDPPSRSG